MAIGAVTADTELTIEKPLTLRVELTEKLLEVEEEDVDEADDDGDDDEELSALSFDMTKFKVEPL